MIDWASLGYAFALLLIGFLLAIAEVFIVSFGLLGAIAVASLGGAVYFAFQVGIVTGWLFIVIAVLLVVVTLRWGMRRIQASTAVPRSVIASNAGYRHVAERLGISVGSEGTMVTPAYPSGRARFAGGECDVQAQGRALERDARVVVKRIDGPIIFVAPAGGDPSS